MQAAAGIDPHPRHSVGETLRQELALVGLRQPLRLTAKRKQVTNPARLHPFNFEVGTPTAETASIKYPTRAAGEPWVLAVSAAFVPPSDSGERALILRLGLNLDRPETSDSNTRGAQAVAVAAGPTIFSMQAAGAIPWIPARPLPVVMAPSCREKEAALKEGNTLPHRVQTTQSGKTTRLHPSTDGAKRPPVFGGFPTLEIGRAIEPGNHFRGAALVEYARRNRPSSLLRIPHGQ